MYIEYYRHINVYIIYIYKCIERERARVLRGREGKKETRMSLPNVYVCVCVCIVLGTLLGSSMRTHL